MTNVQRASRPALSSQPHGWRNSSRLSRLPANWDVLRKDVLIRDKYTCRLRGTGCTSVATEVDHIIAGDDHRLLNLRAVCSTCHGRKSSQEGHAAKAARRALKKRPPQRHPGRMT